LPFVGLCLLAATGCSSSGAVAGKITYKGASLKGGSISLIPESGGQTVSAPIKEDGTYTFLNVRTGKYKVCVETSSLKPKGNTGGYAPKATFIPKGGYGPPPGAPIPDGYAASNPAEAAQANSARRYVAIPPEYESPETTPLKLDVTGGSQPHDIRLE
jgi:hypothetical protein